MPRAMWSGTISFGLVNVPVKLYTVLQDHDIHFHMLSKDGSCRLRRKLYCPETGDEFDWKNTARGAEVGPDQYVVVTDDELQSLKPKAARTIEIKHFVDLDQIDPIYYDRPYYLLPDEHGATAYELLLEAMKKANRVGIATFVMRGKEYLAAIRPMGDVLCLETMNYADEIVDIESLAPEHHRIDRKQLEAAYKLIEALETDFDPENYRNDYRDRVEELIKKKAKGQEVITQIPAEEEPPRVINLMKALEASIAEAKKPSHHRTRRRKSA